MPADQPGSTPDPVDPLSPERARELLFHAGVTVDVAETDGAAARLGEPRGRGAATLIAIAAAVVLIAGLGFFVTGRGGDEPAPPATTPTAPAVSPSPGDTDAAYSYPDGQVPSLFGYTAREATRLLEEEGWSVLVRDRRVGCDLPGQVRRTTPAPGTQHPSGADVLIEVVRRRLVIDCVGEIDWQPLWELIRFARGLDGVPAVRDRVEVSVASAQTPYAPFVTGSIEGDAREDPDGWSLCADAVCHNPIHVLAGMVTDPRRWDGQSPVLRATWAADDDCGPADPRPDGATVRLWTEVEVPGAAEVCPETAVEVTFDELGRIVGVAALTDAAPAPGLDDPTGGDDTSTTAAVPDPTREAAAQAFVDWARAAGPAPDFALTVRFLVGGGRPGFGMPRMTEPEVRAWWSGCSGLGGLTCGISPVARLLDYGGPVAVTPGASACASPDVRDGIPGPTGSVADLTEDLRAEDLIALSRPDLTTCATDLRIELYVDPSGQIYAVNLV